MKRIRVYVCMCVILVDKTSSSVCQNAASGSVLFNVPISNRIANVTKFSDHLMIQKLKKRLHMNISCTDFTESIKR